MATTMTGSAQAAQSEALLTEEHPVQLIYIDIKVGCEITMHFPPIPYLQICIKY